MAEPLGRRTAWHDIDVMLLALATVVGAGAWITASVGVGYAKTANGEIAWANLGIVGLIVFGSAVALWLLRGRRAIGARRASLIRLEPARTQGTASTALGTATANPVDVRAVRVRVQGGSLVHETACPLVVGKTLERVNDVSGTDVAHCQVCAP